jgi:chromosome segregation protein
LEEAKNKLKNEQKAVDEIIKIFASANINISIDPITEVIRTIEKAKELINDNETNKAITLLDRSKIELNNFLNSLENDASKNKLTSVNEKNENIKLLQENYADSFSKNQSIKKESIKRNERIRAIETEIDSWKNLLSNSEKMVKELSERKNKLSIQLNDRDKQPQIQAEKKGQISEGLRIAENEKIENEKIIDETDKKIDSQRILLNEIQERSIQIRERKASSGATIEGLKKRKNDLLDRVQSELNLKEDDILENSSLNGVENLPDSVEQEEILDKKKREREKLGSVN